MIIVPQKSSKTDDFTSANQSGLSRAGFSWAQPNSSIPRINVNTAANQLTGGYFPAVLIDHAAKTDTHAASCFNVSTLNAVQFGLIVGADDALDNYAIALIGNTDVYLGYATGPLVGDLGSWAAKGSAPSSTAAGQAWRLEKHIADNGAMYRVYCNSTLELEYTDTALTVPNGENNRYGGIIVQRSGFTSSTAVDGFSIFDFY